MFSFRTYNPYITFLHVERQSSKGNFPDTYVFYFAQKFEYLIAFYSLPMYFT